LPWIAPDLGSYFYQSRILAVTHLVTPGWISTTICGVLYKYVPGLLLYRGATERGVRPPMGQGRSESKECEDRPQPNQGL
jgi:hypothetical protein